MFYYQNIIDGAKKVIENYRPSFQINPKWDIKSLGQLATFQYGYTTNGLEKGNIKYIRITDINSDGSLNDTNNVYTNINSDNKKFILKKYDILTARIGATAGKTLIYDSTEPAIFASYLIRILLNSEILPHYYFYYTQSDDYWRQVRSLITGGGQPQFNANTLKLLNIPVPPLDEQKEIVGRIDAERNLIYPAYQLIDLFTKKIQDRINSLFEER